MFCPSGTCWCVNKFKTNLQNSQFQLCLGDYFKEYELAQDISEKATGLIGWINNHGKVRMLMDKSQATISRDRLNRVLILAYLVANLTRWTTHCTSFICLLAVKSALRLAVMQSRAAIIAAEVCAATGAKERELVADAEHWCEVIDNSMFWEGLDHVVGDLKPICYATNIGQKDSTRANTILLSLVGVFLHFAEHPIKAVAMAMSKDIEKRWKDCDQPLFLLCLVLNPFEILLRFGEKAGLNRFKWKEVLLQVSILYCSLYHLYLSHGYVALLKSEHAPIQSRLTCCPPNQGRPTHHCIHAVSLGNWCLCRVGRG